ncbi:MAG: carotenoid biosynthesis protein, partial [Myxococcaceae bacterium]|nr:carotenoid biosynthesis protein [Myxococcaceae bacterium]
AKVSFEWLLAEALLLACWVRALVLGRTVVWRGRVLRLGAHGALT